MFETHTIRFLVLILGALICCLALPSSANHTSVLGETPAQQAERMQWFRDAKLGMFVHWGPVSVAGTELSWSRKAPKPFDVTGDKERGSDPVYDALYKQFNPVKFNANEWVKIAKSAGMKYLVFTAKHHDGFSNYFTKYSDYNIANGPFKRDIVKELADACHKGGLKFGVYYSPRDWYHPDYLIGDNQKYREFMKNQLRELLTNYGKVDIVWFDSYGATNPGDPKVYDEIWKPFEVLDMIHKLQPKAIVNNRLAVLASYDHPANPDLWCDYNTPEERVGTYQYGRAWESCMTLVGGQWSYKPNGDMYSREKCLRILLNTVTGDGNLLLNIGPMPTGEIEARQVERLKEIGEWLNKNGESVYGTRGGPFKPGEWGGSTRKGKSIYLHVFKWDGDTLKLPVIPAKIRKATVLSGGKATFLVREDQLEITLPAQYRQKIDTIIKLEIDKAASDIESVAVVK